MAILFIGRRVGRAALATDLDLACDPALRPQGFADLLRAKGLGWWVGYASPKNALNRIDFAKRTFKDSRFPVETLKRVDKTTTFIDEERIPRVPTSSEFFPPAPSGTLAN